VGPIFGANDAVGFSNTGLNGHDFPTILADPIDEFAGLGRLALRVAISGVGEINALVSMHPDVVGGC